MESDVTQSAAFYKAWAWAETHKKQLLWAGVAVVVVGLGIAFWVVHQNQTQVDANDALSKATSVALATPGAEPSADDLLKVANEHAGTDAAGRAVLLAAAQLFSTGKYADAQAQFQKFLQEHAGSPFAPQAALGVAASLDALGKTNEALSAYHDVAERYRDHNVAPQARLAEARLLEGQGKLKEARALYAELSNSVRFTTIGQQAARRLEEISAAHPELTSTNQPAPLTIPSVTTNKPK